MLKQKGFTLIELMIVVAIIAILGAIAFPSYQDSVRKTRRAGAQAGLMELASFMERNFTEANRYDQDDEGNAIALPFAQSPRLPGTAYYVLTLASAARTYTLTATPQGGQAADTCETMKLDETGLKTHGVVNVNGWDC